MIDDRDNDDNDGRRKYVNLMWSLDLVKWRKAGEDKRRWRLKRPRPGRECKAKRPRHAPLVFNFFATAPGLTCDTSPTCLDNHITHLPLRQSRPDSSTTAIMNPQMYALPRPSSSRYVADKRMLIRSLQHQPRDHPCDDAGQQEDPLRRP